MAAAPLLLQDWRAVPPAARGATVALGNFDGVHRGHHAVLAAAHAARPDLPLAVLTFEPHPREFFRPGDPPFRLTLLPAKLAAFGPLGCATVLALPFDAALAAGPALVKPNRAELAALLGRPLPDRDALVAAGQELRDRGIARVVVSDGGEGALFVLPGATLWATPPKVALTTTVGAGDAMVAGLAAAIARGLDAEATARLATGCAAAAVSRDVGAPGGGVPLLAEIERLSAQCRIERL